MTVFEQGKKAKQTLTFMSQVTTEQKNNALGIIADMLEENIEKIVSANNVDIENGRQNGLNDGLIDRLMLNADRIKAMADGARQVASLPDPCGRVLSEYKKDNGLLIKKITVPLGVIDSNTALADIMREALAKAGLPQDVIQLVGDTSRQSSKDMMHMNEYLDCLIPRGGKGLIKAVVENSTVPVIETGSGNCHIYVDESADINMAANIIFNAKTQRISVCNACESLVINSKIIDKALPVIAKKLKEKDVEIRGDERAQKACSLVVPATDEDFATEYLDYIISVKTVDTVDEAIAHINANSTGHSEAIITQNTENAEKFLKCIDSSSVYVNASTRFTDGAEFGLGAEIGISTQKLHARGPMGLEQLTSTKYLIYGDGQVR